jgi:hypothetical protein
MEHEVRRDRLNLLEEVHEGMQVSCQDPMVPG